MNANAIRAFDQFLDVLTGRAPADTLSHEMLSDEPEPGNNELDDDENWRDGTMADGLRRARRARP